MSNLYKRVPGEGEIKSLGAIKDYSQNLFGFGMIIVPYEYPIPSNSNFFDNSNACSMKDVHNRVSSERYTMPSFVVGAPYSLDELSHLDLLSHFSDDDLIQTYPDIIINDPGPGYEPFQLTDGVLG